MMATKKQTTKKTKPVKAGEDKKQPLIIRIGWDRQSHLLADFTKTPKPLMDDSQDWGCYQIYGQHPVYGSDTLLYIGMCGETEKTQQTFGTRMRQHYEEWLRHDPYYQDARVYVGRLVGEEQERVIKMGSDAQKEWAKHIRWAEKLLIFFHTPAHNYLHIKRIPRELWEVNVRVFNFGNCRKLQGEVSSDYYHEYNEKYTKGNFGHYRLI